MRKSLLVLTILLASIFYQVSCEARIITEENKVWGNKSFRVEKVLQDRSGTETSVKETITFEKFIKPQLTGIENLHQCTESVLNNEKKQGSFLMKKPCFQNMVLALYVGFFSLLNPPEQTALAESFPDCS